MSTPTAVPPAASAEAQAGGNATATPVEMPPAQSADSGDHGVAAAPSEAGPTSTSGSSISMAPDGVIVINDSPSAVRDLADAARDCDDRGKRTFCLGLATVIAQEWYARFYGAGMPVWLGPDHPIVEVPFSPFAIPDFPPADIERMAILTAANGLRYGDQSALQLARGATGLGTTLPETVAIMNVLGSLGTLNRTMRSRVPARYLAGAVRRKLGAEMIQHHQARMVPIRDADKPGAVLATAGIDISEYLDALRASGSQKDVELAHTIEMWLDGVPKEQIGDNKYQRMLYFFRQPRAKAIARRTTVTAPRMSDWMHPPGWFYTIANRPDTVWHDGNARLLR